MSVYNNPHNRACLMAIIPLMGLFEMSASTRFYETDRNKSFIPPEIQYLGLMAHCQILSWAVN